MLFMKTILSLSLATFALAIPVAQPQAVGDLGGVGLIGRSDTDSLFEGIHDIVNNFLSGAVESGSLDQSTVDLLNGEIDGIVQDALGDAGDSGLDDDGIDIVFREIEDDVHAELSNAVETGNLAQDLVDQLLSQTERIVGPALRAGFDAVPPPS